ncbi:helix-turn-helix domain-containing protein [Marasmitruncus massiliensis]|nr:helix-turn-helix domain-containing protein [Marasmitruncus massiliensis]
MVYSSPKAEQLREILTKYKGDRGKTAAELGIRKTTLWRRIKKYGLEEEV